MSVDVLTDGAGREVRWDQAETWAVAQAIRNQLEMFHGGGALDPDAPDAGYGFISDDQMRALNIVIRRTVHDVLGKLRLVRGAMKAAKRREPFDDEMAALHWLTFQLAGVHDYMEPPGTPELEMAFAGLDGEGS